MQKFKIAWLAFFIALVTTTTMDFSGYTMFSSLILLPITLIFWVLTKSSKVEMGLCWGEVKHYGMAIFLPFLLLGLTALVAFLSGDFSVGDVKYKNILLSSTVGIIGVLITEEAFFRGWLWGVLQKRGMNGKNTLITTSLLFTAWHISAVTSGTEYGLPLYQVPIYLVNATLLGLIWGMFRSVSGSVIVPTVYHSIWNALAYDLFGFGEKTGALGVTNTILFGPEVGVLGIVINGGLFLWLWNRYRTQFD
jgi:membrane protease YdiL (CAAX protease family)